MRSHGASPRLRVRGWWCVVSLALVCTAFTSASQSSSGSQGVSVELPSVRDGSSSQWQREKASAAADGAADEVRFPGESEMESGGAKVDVSSASSSDGSVDKLPEVVASPVVTEPLLVLAALDTSAKPSQGSAEKQQAEDGTVGEVPVSTEPAEEMHGVPSNPSLVNAVAYDGRAAVTWKAPDDDGLDAIVAYEVGWFDEEENAMVGTQRVAPSSVSLIGANASASAAADLVPTSTVVEPLVNGRSYTFKVRAQNVNGFSVWSAKSLAVSPLHPPDLCERLSCSGHGTCFPNYHNDRPATSAKGRHNRGVTALNGKDSSTAIDEYSHDAVCICRPGYSPPDCSAKSSEDEAQYVWHVTQWSECDSGCGGGRRSREAVCFDVSTNQKAPSESFCTDLKPSVTDICNGIECGSKRVVVRYEVEMSYDEVLFSPAAKEAFELAFTTEIASALQIPHWRLEITALERGSIVVFFQILPASRVGEKSLNDIVENLQSQLGNDTSTLRSMGTFARRIEPNAVKLTFSIADQTVAGGAEDISIAGLIGTMVVLAFFVSMFGWFLRRRHYRLLKDTDTPTEDRLSATAVESPGGGMKRMNIKSTT
jgi:hypothetical protein